MPYTPIQRDGVALCKPPKIGSPWSKVPFGAPTYALNYRVKVDLPTKSYVLKNEGMDPYGSLINNIHPEINGYYILVSSSSPS